MNYKTVAEYIWGYSGEGTRPSAMSARILSARDDFELRLKAGMRDVIHAH